MLSFRELAWTAGRLFRTKERSHLFVLDGPA